MHRSAVYLGDLLQALQATGAWQPGMPFPNSGKAMADFAVACGFDAPVFARKMEEELPPPLEEHEKPPQQAALLPPRPVSKDGKPAGERRLEFWHIAEKHQASAEELASRRKTPDFILNAPEASNSDWEFEWKPSPGRGLLPWKRLWPFLKGVLGAQRRSLQLDVPRTVKKMALAVPLRRFPLRKRQAWQTRAVLLVDYHPALAPFWDDYDWLLRRLSAVRGKLGLSVVRTVWGGDFLWDAKKKRRWQPPATGAETSILALGDLSQFHPEQAELAHWLRLGRQLTRRGLRPWALCPCPRERWSTPMSHTWSLACWDHGMRLPTGRGRRGLSAQPPLLTEQNEIQAQHERQLLDLLRLASPALHVERGLLRDLRLLLPHEADAGTEYDAFQSADFTGSESARQFAPRLQAALRRELMDTARVPLPLFLSAIRLLLAHHWHSRAVFGAQEWDGILDTSTPEHLAALGKAGLLHEGVYEDIRLHWEKLAAGLLRQSYGEHQSAMRPFAASLVSNLQESGLTSDTTARRAKEIIWRLHHSESKRLAPWVRPESIEFIEPQQTLKVQALTLREGLQLDLWMEEWAGGLGVIQGHRMTLGLSVEGEQPNQSFKAERDWAASTLLTEEELRHARRVTLNAGDERLILEKMCRPAWASRMWYDGGGLQAEAALGKDKVPFTWMLQETIELERREDGHNYRINHGRHVAGWQATKAPKWSSRLWVDEFGLAAEFRIKDVPFVLRWIPSGSFLMGSPEDEPGRTTELTPTGLIDEEGPQHRVTISKGYWMAETPVTRRQWQAVVEAGRDNLPLWKKIFTQAETLSPNPSYFQGPGDLPVESVTWHESRNFCRLLNALLPDGPGFHLPTEVQWEYACRAGTETAIYSGGIVLDGEVKSSQLAQIAWYGGNSGTDLEVANPQDSTIWLGMEGSQKAGTHRVGLKMANPWGLFDTLGNVWEWCGDEWDDQAYSKRRGIAKIAVPRPIYTNLKRVARGGSWNNAAKFCRAAYRSYFVPDDRGLILGLRLAAGKDPIGNTQEQQTSNREIVSPVSEERLKSRDSGRGPFTRADTY
jgi:formylglycine-generating enzyme required for sulfatase activity